MLCIKGFPSTGAAAAKPMAVAALLLALTLAACEDDDGATPDPATGFSATGGIGHVDLAWTAPAAGTAAIEFVIVRDVTTGEVAYPQDEVGRVAADTTAFTDNGVSNGTRYYYQVVAVNRGGSSTPTAEMTALPRDYSSNPDEFKASDGQANDEYGTAMAKASGVLLVGAPNEDGGSGDLFTDAGAVYLYEQATDLTWGETTALRGSNTDAGDQLGISVAISGTIFIVGAPFEDGSGDTVVDSGAAYVFEQASDGSWGETALLRASDAQTGDKFGVAVAISGNYAVVGANVEDGGSGDPSSAAGAAYVFERQSDGSWNEVAILHASDAQFGDIFGNAVSISGDFLAVGAPFEDGGSGDPLASKGAVYIFERQSNGSWAEVTALRASDGEASDFFGTPVSISGDILLVGVTGDTGETNTLSGAGAVYAYQRDSAGVWGQVQILRASDRDSGDAFGAAVAHTGTLAVIGAPGEDGGQESPESAAGAGYVFEMQSDGTWAEVRILAAPSGKTNDRLGTAAAIFANDILLGAPFADSADGSVSDAGAVYFY